MRKIRGAFCERKVGRARRAGTFRWKKSGRAWILLSCAKGRRRRGGCSAYKILVPAHGRCAVGRRVTK